MTHLTCSVSNCASNVHNLCCRPDITVEGGGAGSGEQTCCLSFQHRSDAVTASTAAGTPCEQTQVHCGARDCLYNQDALCAADRVCVEGDGACDCQQTCCGTFRRERE